MKKKLVSLLLTLTLCLGCFATGAFAAPLYPAQAIATGDNSGTFIWILIALVVLCGGAVAFLIIRGKNKNGKS